MFGRIAALAGSIRLVVPGVTVATMVALAAQFVAEHYGAPAMLMALLFGIALNFLSAPGPTAAGVGFTARSVLRFGVALLGARISIDMLTSLGWSVVVFLIVAVIATVGFGVLLARATGQTACFAVLTAGAVAICGASAAMAIAAVLPKNDQSERNLLFTVLGVTVLSTIAMILYPMLTAALDFDDFTAGVFIGATVHDVAQVVGAGFSISATAGETSTLVKLMRVSFLAPFVVIIAMSWKKSMKDEAGGRPPLIPTFVVGYLLLAAMNSIGLIPSEVGLLAASVASWALLAAIAAVGMKTDLRNILNVGGGAIILIVAETMFLAGLVLAAMTMMNFTP